MKPSVPGRLRFFELIVVLLSILVNNRYCKKTIAMRKANARMFWCICRSPPRWTIQTICQAARSRWHQLMKLAEQGSVQTPHPSAPEPWNRLQNKCAVHATQLEIIRLEWRSVLIYPVHPQMMWVSFFNCTGYWILEITYCLLTLYVPIWGTCVILSFLLWSPLSSPEVPATNMTDVAPCCFSLHQ